jgi:hypothetical protein
MILEVAKPRAPWFGVPNRIISLQKLIGCNLRAARPGRPACRQTMVQNVTSICRMLVEPALAGAAIVDNKNLEPRFHLLEQRQARARLWLCFPNCQLLCIESPSLR